MMMATTLLTLVLAECDPGKCPDPVSLAEAICGATGSAPAPWSTVAEYSRRCGWCDLEIAELVSGCVAKLLAERWDTVPGLTRLIAKDARLLPFVVDHLRSGVAGREWLELIVRQAKAARPASVAERRLVARLAKAAAEGLAEAERPPP